MKIITYNVNGIRAAIQKGFLEWIKAADPDILLLQETKAQPEQIPVMEFEMMGYRTFWHSAQKKGYSGVAILTKIEPDRVISGDYNICHRPTDIHDPVRNATSSGFLPEEREWMTKFLDSGFIDTFRHFNNEPHQYTWWSYRVDARSRNLGWRIDYHMVTHPLENRLLRVTIMPDAMHSDHCPVMLELR